MTPRLTETDLRRRLRPEAVLAAIRDGLLRGPAGDPGDPATGRLAGLPGHSERGAGAVRLFDAAGRAVADLDAGWLAVQGTAAAAALAAQALARPEATTIGFVGCGEVAAATLRLLRRLRSVGALSVHDTDPARAAAFAARAAVLGHPASVAAPDAVAAAAGIVILADGAGAAPDGLAPGAHLSAAGAAAAVLAAAPAAAGVRRFADTAAPGIAALGPVLAGAAAGRQAADEITLFAGGHRAWADFALAAAACGTGGP